MKHNCTKQITEKQQQTMIRQQKHRNTTKKQQNKTTNIYIHTYIYIYIYYIYKNSTQRNILVTKICRIAIYTHFVRTRHTQMLSPSRDTMLLYNIS